MPSSQIENKIPGLDKIGGGVDTKTASYAAWNSITSFLKLPTKPTKWEPQNIHTKTYNVPTGFRVSVANNSTTSQVAGCGRDEYIKSMTIELNASGSYGGFSGTLNSSFGMSEDTTRAYSFGTHNFEQPLYSLTLPTDLTGLLDPVFEKDLNGDMPAIHFYEKWGTHYTQSIIMGGKASLSLYSQYDSEYSKEEFKVDLQAAYENISGNFKTEGTFNYTSSTSKEKYQSSSDLVLTGGDSTEKNIDAWKMTIEEAPQFIDFNKQMADGYGLKPFYELLPSGPRYDLLKDGLADYLNPPLGVKFFCKASILTEKPDAGVEVPPGYKVLSGGATLSTLDGGIVLTASYPIAHNQWAAEAKNPSTPDQTILTVFAVAVYDPYGWLDVKSFPETSGDSELPTASASVDDGYVLTGGGAITTYTGSGSYLTASYPTSFDTWKAASKSTHNLCSASITVYAIGVKWSSNALALFPALEAITSDYTLKQSSPAAHPHADVAVSDGSTLVGGGAFDDYGTGWGNMLTASYPSNATTWQANGKDHEHGSPAPLTVFAIGVKNMVDPTRSPIK